MGPGCARCPGGFELRGRGCDEARGASPGRWSGVPGSTPLRGKTWSFSVRASVGSVRGGVEDLDGHAAAVRQRVGGLVADLLAVDGRSERRVRRVHVDGGADLLP